MMKRFLVAVPFAVISGYAAANPAEGDDAAIAEAAVLEAAQGTWVHDLAETADPTDRMVKRIEGNKETFSIYRGGELAFEQTVDFEIDVRGGVAVFTLRNLKVTAGPRAGREGGGEFSYLLRIRGDEWAEVQGLMDGDGAEPRLTVYRRVAGGAGGVPAAEARAAAPPVEEVTLLGTLAGWMYPGSELLGDATMSDGGDPAVRSVNLRAVLTTPDPVEEVFAFYSEKLSLAGETGRRAGVAEAGRDDPKSVAVQDVSPGGPYALKVITVDKAGSSTTLVIGRTDGEAKMHIAWTHHVRFGNL